MQQNKQQKKKKRDKIENNQVKSYLLFSMCNFDCFPNHLSVCWSFKGLWPVTVVYGFTDVHTKCSDSPVWGLWLVSQVAGVRGLQSTMFGTSRVSSEAPALYLLGTSPVCLEGDGIPGMWAVAPSNNQATSRQGKVTGVAEGGPGLPSEAQGGPCGPLNRHRRPSALSHPALLDRGQ